MFKLNFDLCDISNNKHNVLFCFFIKVVYFVAKVLKYKFN